MQVISELFSTIGMGLCHRFPERSFAYGGIQFPVCARDTGMYLGIIAGLIVLYLLYRREHRTEFPPLATLLILLVLMGTLAFDGVSSYAGLRESNNMLRLATGMAGGFALAGMLYPIINDSILPNPQRKRVLDTPSAVGIFLGALVAVFCVVNWLFPFLGIAYALLSCASIIVVFMLLNMTLVCVVSSKRTNAVGSLRAAVVPALWGIVLSAIEIGLMAGINLLLA